jgi:hypothetical protein
MRHLEQTIATVVASLATVAALVSSQLPEASQLVVLAAFALAMARH